MPAARRRVAWARAIARSFARSAPPARPRDGRTSPPHRPGPPRGGCGSGRSATGTLARPAASIAWSLALERASGKIDLQALARREAVLSVVRGAEARLAIRKSAPGERKAASPGAPPWSVRITDVRIAGVREAAFGPNRLVGNGQIEGSLAASMEGGEQSFRLDRLALSFDSARIEIGPGWSRAIPDSTDPRTIRVPTAPPVSVRRLDPSQNATAAPAR
jgi:hypothetical protein